ncbi:MAG: DUF2065 domain-containing protein [Cellvibrionaceae bacterium]
MWDDIVRALCLVLIFEGMIPFLYPNRWRELVLKLSLMSEKNLRLIGLISMAIGVCVLYVIR